MNRRELLAFLRRHSLAVQASVSEQGAPQAAVIGYVVTDDLEIFFDTLSSSRKFQNLQHDPRIALVIGWDDDCTVQYEGLVDEPSERELAALQDLYFARFPDGVSRRLLPGIAYLRARPTWIRYSDFRSPYPTVVELDPSECDAPPPLIDRTA